MKGQHRSWHFPDEIGVVGEIIPISCLATSLKVLIGLSKSAERSISTVGFNQVLCASQRKVEEVTLNFFYQQRVLKMVKPVLQIMSAALQ